MSNIIGQRHAGNIVYIENDRTHGHRLKWLDAVGSDVVKFITDFVGEPVDLTSGEFDPRWTITRVEAGAGESTFGPSDEAGGVGVITTDANDNDGINAQLRGESFKLATGKPLYFGVRMKLSEATQSDFFVGLAVTDTDILGGVTDSIGFDKVDAATAIKAYANKNSTRTEVTTALVAETTSYHEYEFYFDGAGHIRFFVDNVETTALAVFTNIPDDEELRPTIQFLAGSAGAKTCKIDWMRCIQIGR